MKVLLWFTIFARVILCLRGDDDASRTLLLGDRGQRRMETSAGTLRQPLNNLNLFRRDSSGDGLENRAEENIMTEKYSVTDTNEASNDIKLVAETESSKGKGKGRSRTSKDRGKGKGKRSSSKSPKSPKKEKSTSKKSSKPSLKKKNHGKGHMMNHVSGKGKGQTSGPSASHHHSSKNHISGKGKGSESSPPASSPQSSPNPSPTPPTASGPTATPSVTPTPIGEALPLSDFVLAYVFDREEVPSDSDVNAAVTVTRTYLNGFSKQRLGELKELDTRKKFSEATEFPSTFQIGFGSTAFFVVGTDPLPTVGEMDLLTTLAFSGENLRTYLGLLGQLPEANIFSTTSDVYDSVSRPDDTDTVAKASNVAIGASASAGAFIALLIGVAFYRKRSTYVDLDKLAHDGHITVAGETYIGGSTMYSSSGLGNRIHQTHMGDDAQSMWGISTKAGTEDCASEGGESMDFGEDTLEHQLGDLSYAHLIRLGEGVREDGCIYQHDPLAPVHVEVDQYSSDSESRRISGTLSCEEHAEDADVPLRVVDLIRRFSPL